MRQCGCACWSDPSLDTNAISIKISRAGSKYKFIVKQQFLHFFYKDDLCTIVVMLLFFSMLKLLKPGAGITYSDLVVSFESMDQEDIPGPPVRYHFGL